MIEFDYIDQIGNAKCLNESLVDKLKCNFSYPGGQTTISTNSKFGDPRLVTCWETGRTKFNYDNLKGFSIAPRDIAVLPFSDLVLAISKDKGLHIRFDAKPYEYTKLGLNIEFSLDTLGIDKPTLQRLKISKKYHDVTGYFQISGNDGSYINSFLFGFIHRNIKINYHFDPHYTSMLDVVAKLQSEYFAIGVIADSYIMKGFHLGYLHEFDNDAKISGHINLKEKQFALRGNYPIMFPYNIKSKLYMEAEYRRKVMVYDSHYNISLGTKFTYNNISLFLRGSIPNEFNVVLKSKQIDSTNLNFRVSYRDNEFQTGLFVDFK